MRITGILKYCVPQCFHPYLRGLRDRILFRTAGLDSYQSKIQEELDHYSGTENVHALPPITTYWFDKHLLPILQAFGFGSSVEMFRTYIARVCRAHPGEICSVLSIGAGDSATEINVAQWLLEQGIQNFRFDCMDLNPEVLDRGRRLAAEKGFADRFHFAPFDIHGWKPGRTYDVILAIQCLHHFVELELLFDKIHEALRPNGYFLTDDMIGRNGHQRWPEAMRLVDEFWKELPGPYKYNHLLKRVENQYENWDCSKSGFEGIRAQDILPLLVQRFHFDFFFGFGNVIDVFVDRTFGPNFDPAREWDRDFIDRVHATDDAGFESGSLKPTHIYAAMRKHPADNPKFYKQRTPELSVRNPEI